MTRKTEWSCGVIDKGVFCWGLKVDSEGTLKSSDCTPQWQELAGIAVGRSDWKLVAENNTRLPSAGIKGIK